MRRPATWRVFCLPAVAAVASIASITAASAATTMATASTAAAGAPSATTTAAISAASAAATSARAFCLRPCFIHHQIASAEILTIQRIHRAIRILVAIHFDEGESTRLSRKPVTNEIDA
jgi:hypothetical protein